MLIVVKLVYKCDVSKRILLFFCLYNSYSWFCLLAIFNGGNLACYRYYIASVHRYTRTSTVHRFASYEQVNTQNHFVPSWVKYLVKTYSSLIFRFDLWLQYVNLTSPWMIYMVIWTTFRCRIELHTFNIAFI